MLKRRIIAGVILVLGALLAFGMFRTSSSGAGWFAKYPFRFGLDLSGGSHLLYDADISALPSGEVNDSMDALRDVIERRINLFGVAEPTVQVQTSALSGQKVHRLSIELPGVTDITEAIKMIGATPFLEFRTLSTNPTTSLDKNGTLVVDTNSSFVPTELTGKYLQRASLVFNQTTGAPIISLQFNGEGSKLFEQITSEHVGEPVAIYLDGQVLSAPTVREAISGGQAQITGSFTAQEARELVGRLNSGALPVPISLASTQTIGAVLGASAVNDGVRAAAIGFGIIALFLIAWYRLPGLVAVVALILYVITTLMLYRLIPVTLTAAGIAGFIISIGVAVDANILIFERAREERTRGKKHREAIDAGFSRAWFSIRDANIAALIISVILFWFGTSLIKGFALTLGLGVIVSLLSAITITRLFLRALPALEGSKAGDFLFSSGFRSKK
ncbi:protein translocase subunit SecD [Candidatus Nomurabacteria bacterium]|nr:protein translocase subunit SecD [Candidatus Nomurabacteria bacterium]